MECTSASVCTCVRSHELEVKAGSMLVVRYLFASAGREDCSLEGNQHATASIVSGLQHNQRCIAEAGWACLHCNPDQCLISG